MDRYAFTVRLFHSQHLAGLTRRTRRSTWILRESPTVSVGETVWGAVGWGDDTIRRPISRQVVRAVILPQANSKKRSHRRIRIPESEVAQFVVGAAHSIGSAPTSGILRARVDPLTREQRSHQMSLVRAKHTRPEKVVRAALTRLGYRYRLHPRNVPGRPDIVIRRLRSAILVHGCFWHRHRGCTRTRMPKTRVDFWSTKFSNNIARDRSVRSQLRRDGVEDARSLGVCVRRPQEA